MNGDKTLSPVTIIPRELYVHRDADRQLHKVIVSMGRPAYVLVSRQMGKTNLLINAMRELTTESTCFAYVDLSTKATTARECFRIIIDTVLLAIRENATEIKSAIAATRKDIVTQPNREHEAELLEILRICSKNIVVVLDEIDALTTSSFSDEIFAQIRSSYFTRINYPEFERLTYVLSGVVEPTQLIKDRNKSPFNIGEKIYLDDFSYDEYRAFLNQAKLLIDDSAVNRIYDRLQGHPRMTWDVCSEIEDINSRKGIITTQDVDAVINKLYLNNYDTPPVDHIRDLVRSDSALRRAIKRINKYDTKGISDSVKKKLYLAGIIQSDISSEEIVLKNDVIKACLSDDWLNSLEDLRLTLLALGDEQNHLGNHAVAARHYKEFLQYADAVDKDLRSAVLSQIGDCLLKINERQEALEHYSRCEFDELTQPDSYFKTLLSIGLCHYLADEYQAAAERFLEIINKQRKTILNCQALLNYAGCLLGIDYALNREAALAIYEELLVELSAVKFVDINLLDDLRMLSHYNIAQLSLDVADVARAKANYERALELNVVVYKPAIYLNLVELEQDEHLQAINLRECFAVIATHKPKFTSPPVAGLERMREQVFRFHSDILSGLIVEAYKITSSDIGSEYADLAYDSYYGSYASRFHMLYNVAMFAANHQSDMEIVARLAQIVVQACVDHKLDDEILLLDAYRLLANSKSPLDSSRGDDIKEFVTLFQKSDNFGRQFIREDLVTFTNHVIEHRKNSQFAEIIHVGSWLKSKSPSIPESIRPNFLGIYFLMSQSYEMLGDFANAVAFARESISIVEIMNSEYPSIIGTNQIQSIKRISENIINQYGAIRVPVRAAFKVGRNDLCPCGSGKKYKHCCGKH